MSNRLIQLVKIVVVFAFLVASGVGMMVSSGSIGGPFEQDVLMHIGSALFAGGLAFFLVEIFRWDR